MIIHNRRKRALYYAEQTALLHAQLAAAIAAQKAEEPLSEGQVLLLNRERARVEGEERVKREKGRWWRWMIRGLEADETAEGEGGGEGREEQGRGGVVSAVEGGPREAFGKAEASTREAFTATESKAGSVLQALEDKRREGERPIEEAGGHGGQLDQLATEAGRAKGGWTSWMTRKQ